MGRGIDVRAPALILVLSLLAPLQAEAGFRFDEGVYLGPAKLLADWAAMLARARKQQPALEACLADETRCSPQLRGLHTLVERARELSPDRQLKLVNRYVDRHRYRRDRSENITSVVAAREVHLRSRWSTLVEFLHRGGDCEDYATSKYQLLRELGFPAADLRVLVVYDRSTRAYHAVLAVRRTGDTAWLLDSDNSIHRDRPFGYRFIYALNEKSIWDYELSAEEWSQLTRPQPEEAS